MAGALTAAYDDGVQPVRTGRTYLLLLAVAACSLDTQGTGKTSGGQGSDSSGATGSASDGPTTATAPTQGQTGSTGTSTASTTTTDSNATTVSTDATTADDTGSSSTGSVPSCVTTPPWFDDAWSRRRPLNLDNSTFDAAEQDFVLLVRLDDGRIDYGRTQDNGEDLRFVDEATGQVLDHELERWSNTATSWAWVRLPSLPDNQSTPSTLWMYYGNPNAPDGQSPTAVWDAGFESVHHLTDTLDDSTANGHDGTSPSPPGYDGGRFGRGGSFDGNDQYFEIPPENAFDFTNALTAEAWILVGTFDVAWQAMINKGDDTWRMQRHLNSNQVGFGTDNMGVDNANLQGATNVNDSNWHYAVITYDGQSKRIYVDGTQDASTGFAGPLSTDDRPLWVGANDEAPGREFAGRIDEVRISSVTRDEDWIEAQFLSMTDQLLSFGGEETCP